MVAANATVDGCAIVRKTPDGFLNIRKTPNAESIIIGILKPGEEVIYDAGRETIKWMRVWDGKRWGWAAARFLQPFEC